MTSFYMTDFLCRQFDAFFMKPLGLDRHPELIKDFFGNYEKVVYLAQTDDPELDRVAENAARMLGLAYERRSTGYGDLTPALAEAASAVPSHDHRQLGRLSSQSRQHVGKAGTADEPQPLPGARCVVDAVDRLEHRPAARGVELAIVREVARHHRRRIDDQRAAVVWRERRHAPR